MADNHLDLQGLKCPLPALKTRKALERLQPGDMLQVVVTDPMAAIDIPHLLRQTGDRLAEQREENARLVFRIMKV
jgi:tRNA 2-thiouridine synthesizing protein A